MSTPVNGSPFEHAAHRVLAAVAELETASKEYMREARAVPELTRPRVLRELRESVLRGLPTVNLDGHKHARASALVHGARLSPLSSLATLTPEYLR